MANVGDAVLTLGGSLANGGTATFTPPSGEVHKIIRAMTSTWYAHSEYWSTYAPVVDKWMLEDTSGIQITPTIGFGSDRHYYNYDELQYRKVFADNSNAIRVKNQEETTAYVSLMAVCVATSTDGPTISFTSLGSLANLATATMTAPSGKLRLVCGKNIGKSYPLSPEGQRPGSSNWLVISPYWPRYYFRMPFDDSGTFRLKNRGGTTYTVKVWDVDITDGFTSLMREGASVSTSANSDFTVASSTNWIIYGIGSTYQLSYAYAPYFDICIYSSSTNQGRLLQNSCVTVPGNMGTHMGYSGLMSSMPWYIPAGITIRATELGYGTQEILFWGLKRAV